MTDKNPTLGDCDSAAEARRMELEKLADEQGVHPIFEFDLLRAHFWPDDESIDDFVLTVRERRRS
jgi:hypothetical protein